jgi:predicted Zn-dependent protease
MRKTILLLTAAAVALGSGTLHAQAARYLDQRDVVEAQREHAELVQEFGGAETGPRAAYVDSVGRRVATYSGVANPGQTIHFTTLNSAVENAFSVPGGYVYITRQLLTLMNDESELAFALGHETAHIAARHARARQSYAQRNQVLGVLGAVLGSVLGGDVLGGLLSRQAMQMAQLRTLSFSRDQEYQADTLGLRYMISAGYDPAGAAGILSQLGRASALQARLQGRQSRQTPEWASTHPLSQNRMQRALAAGRATGRIGTGIRNREGFLAQLEGTYVDDDPAQGIIDGRTFTHPDLRIQFSVPAGYLMQNGTRAVSIKGSGGQAQFSGGRFNGALDDYIYRIFQQLTEGRMQLNIPPPRRTVVSGLPAAYTTTRVSTSSGAVDVTVFAYQWDQNTVYHFALLTPAGSGIGPLAPMVNSMRRISAGEAAAIQPRVIRVVSAMPGDTVQSLASRMAYRDYQLDRFLALNGLSTTSRLVPGQRVKLVLHGNRRSG